jgi:hypothetical protein
MIKKINKKAGESLLANHLIFIIGTLIVFITLIIFVSRTSSGDAAYEEIYAKKIALAIDSARPEMWISIDIRELIEKAENKNNLDQIITINNRNVKVTLGSQRGYTHPFFTEAKRIDYFRENNQLKIIISEND